MKVVFVLSFLSLFALSFADDRRCYSQDDCSEESCCTGGITPWIKGFCRKLVEEGKVCDPNPPDTGKYFLTCPCKSGLKCVVTGKVVGGAHCQQE